MQTRTDDSVFKDIFYLIVEKIRASKIALYLLEPGGTYKLATSYGFARTDRIAEKIARTDPLAEFVLEKREPAFINDYRAAGKLKTLLESAGTLRILVAPMFLDGRIVGILDLRDKAGNEPFGHSDVTWTLEVLRRLVNIVRSLPGFSEPVVEPAVEPSVFEQTATFHRLAPARPEPSKSVVDALRSPQPGFARPPSIAPFDRGVPLPPQAADPFPNNADRLFQLVEERIAAAPQKTGAEISGTTARESTFYKMFNEAFLYLPDVEAVALTVFEPREIQVWLAAKRPLTEEAEKSLYENVDRTFAKSSARFAFAVTRKVNPVFAASPETEGPLRKADMGVVQSSVLSIGSSDAYIFTLVFRRGSKADEHPGNRAVHLLVRNALTEIRASIRYREAYRGLVSLFLEPGLKRYTALKSHSMNVGRMVRKFATHLGLAPQEIEQLTVAGILHDVGMRELNYDELYSKKALTDAELRLVRQHSRVGAYLLESVVWPYPVPRIVLHHHEKWDGSGYPGGLAGDDIPLGSRIIHVCEVFDVLTSPTSYRPVVSIPQALEIITSKVGTQFDPEITPAFVELAESLGS